MDCDFLVRTNIGKLFDNLSRSKAVYCVKHDYAPTSTVKMDSQIQTTYPRKNWSSFLAINADHPSNKQLTPELVNSLPGRDLHRLCWLKDEEIGELGEEWNWLVGHSPSDIDPKAAHFTEGLPNLPAFRDVPFADEWRAELNRWAS